ncbi:DUF2884 family protein [Coralloluteibacterium thermophilus]|uniref:DUF2884 family protein n=1 Tax=Coralloluteibacterium thermophilum TaxID=2707049 RepID=A0ABV9NNK0_9GAMM
MRLTTMGLVAALAAAGPVAAGVEGASGGTRCSIQSDYAARTHGKAFVFERQGDGGPTRDVAIGGGRLWLDGSEVVLSAADGRRIREIERLLGEAVPLLREVALDAVDIAFAALGEVARGFGAQPEALARLDAGRERLRARWNEGAALAFGGGGRLQGAETEALAADLVRPILAEFMPGLVAGAVRESLAVALRGGQGADGFEARMARMGEEIERRVTGPAAALEPKAEALCAAARRIEALQSALDLRLPSGDALRLLRAD